MGPNPVTEKLPICGSQCDCVAKNLESSLWLYIFRFNANVNPPYTIIMFPGSQCDPPMEEGHSHWTDILGLLKV